MKEVLSSEKNMVSPARERRWADLMKNIHRSELIAQLSLRLRHGPDFVIVLVVSPAFKLNIEEILEY
jgi:hypothetical protein